MNRKELCKEILNHCRDNNITASFNKVVDNYLVSFKIKKKKTHCKECGKPLTQDSETKSGGKE